MADDIANLPPPPLSAGGPPPGVAPPPVGTLDNLPPPPPGVAADPLPPPPDAAFDETGASAFSSGFWAPDGWDLILSRLELSRDTIKELSNYFQVRLAAEETHAKALQKLRRNIVFANEVGTVKAAVEVLREELEAAYEHTQELVNGFKGGAIEELKRAEASAKVMKKDRGKQHDKLVSKNNKKVDKLDKSRRQFWAAAKKANAALVEYKKIQNDKTVPRIQITNARDASNKMADAADKVLGAYASAVQAHVPVHEEFIAQRLSLMESVAVFQAQTVDYMKAAMQEYADLLAADICARQESHARISAAVAAISGAADVVTWGDLVRTQEAVPPPPVVEESPYQYMTIDDQSLATSLTMTGTGGSGSPGPSSLTVTPQLSVSSTNLNSVTDGSENTGTNGDSSDDGDDVAMPEDSPRMRHSHSVGSLQQVANGERASYGTGGGGADDDLPPPTIGDGTGGPAAVVARPRASSMDDGQADDGKKKSKKKGFFGRGKKDKKKKKNKKDKLSRGGIEISGPVEVVHTGGHGNGVDLNNATAAGAGAVHTDPANLPPPVVSPPVSTGSPISTGPPPVADSSPPSVVASDTTKAPVSVTTPADAVASTDAEGEPHTVLYAFAATYEGELSVDAGVTVRVVRKGEDGWWAIVRADGARGVCPGSYLQPVA